MNRDRRNLLVFTIITITLWMPVYFYLPTLPAYLKYLKGSVTLIGMVGGAYGLAQALLRIPIGLWSDRLGRKKPFIIAGFVAGIFSNILFLTVSNPEWLFWARAMAGVSVTSWVVMTIYISNYFPQEKLVQTMGLLFAASNLGQLIASTSGAYITQLFGWQLPFIIALGTGLVGLFSLAWLEPEQPATVRELSWKEFWVVGTSRAVLTASMVGMVIQYGQWAMVSFFQLKALGLGASKADLGWLTLCNMVPTILIAIVLGKSYTRFGKRVTFVSAFLMLTLGLVALPLAGDLIQLAVFLVIGGLGRGILFPASMSIAVAGIPASQKATAMGVYQALYAIGMFLGPALSGLISEKYGLAGAFWLAAAIVAGGGLAWWFLDCQAEKKNRTISKSVAPI